MRIQNSLRHKAKTAHKDESVDKFTKAILPEVLPYLKLILQDGYNLLKEYGFTDYTRDCASLERRYNSQGMGFIQTTLPNLFDALTTHLETGVSNYPEFKLQKGSKHPRFLRKLFALIFDVHVPDTVQAQAFKIIYQLCAAFSKLEGPYADSVLRKNIAKFIATDEKLGKIQLHSAENHPIMQYATNLITDLFKDEKDLGRHGLPSPGSGATNTPVEKDMRFSPHFLYKQLHEVFDYDLWFNTFYQYIFGGDETEYSQRLIELCEYADYPVSRFKFISKKLGKPRGICIEENEAQIFQQAIRRFLYAFIETHPVTKGLVNFTNQEINRILALKSSLDREYATLDMSEASDRVDRECVLALFLYTFLFDMLAAVSTKFIQLPPDLGVPVTLLANKFAPMGSGVCFPIMGLVHWALITATIATSSMEDSLALSKEVYVYGDDIIVPSRVANLVMTTLPRFGMKMNKEKSFVNSYFRESCGCHAYKGIDVTPTFFKKIKVNDSQSSNSELLISLIAKDYRLRKNGFIATSDYLRSTVLPLFGSMPTVYKDSSILGWKTDMPVDAESLLPWCKGVKSSRDDSQQYLYKFRVLVADEEPLPELLDDRGYWRKHTMLTRDSRDVNGVPEDLRIVWGWVPEPALTCDPHNIRGLLNQRTQECVPDARVRCMMNTVRGVITLSA